MQKVANFAKQYMGVALVVLGICILLSYSFSSFIVSTDSKRAAEMYIGKLKYTVQIKDIENQNGYWIDANSETITDIIINNENATDTYFKLLYESNPNLEIYYYEETTDTDDTTTSYSSPNASLKSKGTTELKLKVVNNSATTQQLILKVSGGYATNALADVEVPSNYSEITKVETPSKNTYFCSTDKTLTQGLTYVNGQYKYSYSSDTVGWSAILADKTSTEPVISKLCTYVNNKPIKSLNDMFSQSAATSLDLSSFDTSNVTDMNYMFHECSVPSLNVSNFDTSNVTKMTAMFANSKANTITGLNKFDTSNVTSMASMFYGSAATSLDLSSFDTSKVTTMYTMFYNAAATEIKGLNKFDTSKVTDMSWMFFTNAATSLDLSNFDTSKVTDMSSMFRNSKATTLDLSSFDTSNVTNMYTMFYNVAAAEIKGLEKFNTSNVTNMSYMLSNTKITSVDLSNFETSKVTNMNSMFENSKFQSLDVSGFNTGKVTDMGSMFRKTSVSEIKGLENFNTSNVTNMSSMFQESTIGEINLSNFDTSNVTDMSNMFSWTAVSMIDLSSFDTRNVTNMSQTFYVCSNLTKIYVSDKFVIDNVTNSSNMFNYSTKLVGGNGTAYNASYVDKTYARIDKSGTPGYFTLKSS